ncbi:MAG: hypothetical protein LBV34_17305 [Nocardiopsaceae bacterium]|nr:hypothetical protein [Nocardiopsaceae bacterium]
MSPGERIRSHPVDEGLGDTVGLGWPLVGNATGLGGRDDGVQGRTLGTGLALAVGLGTGLADDGSHLAPAGLRLGTGDGVTGLAPPDG